MGGFWPGDEALMKFAAITDIAPGDSLLGQCEMIAAAGCQGFETLIFPEISIERWQKEVRRAASATGLELVTVILGGGLDLYLPQKMTWVREALNAIAEVGAAALLTPEYRPQHPLPLFPPYPAPPQAEQEQVDRAVNEIGQQATHLEMPVFFEPITQFESRSWRDVETVLAVCRRLNNPQIKLCLDFHNMNITEANIEQSIYQAGPWIGHIHLADNNRRLPGQGHIDFKAGLVALQESDYQGWYTFECGISGDFQKQMRQTIEWLKSLVLLECKRNHDEY